MRLYDYYRSSAAYRVRIALNLKGLAPKVVPVHLLRDGGENFRADYMAKNPLALVPTLEVDGRPLIQSLAIIEYLEETHPAPPLLPPDAPGRARVRAIAQTVACEIHPLNNLRVLDYLVGTLGVDEAEKLAWYRHWVDEGLAGLERLLGQDESDFCHGDAPTMADCCLIPQLYNARRFDCPLDAFPRLLRIAERCEWLPAFIAAQPENQPAAN
ncbi:MAG: maleylacetoacetate isomerase [Gammaproteobacteria bacterium]|nr:maleylacetoacetate isomerase [Gammaproteobacteria bacterium]